MAGVDRPTGIAIWHRARMSPLSGVFCGLNSSEKKKFLTMHFLIVGFGPAANYRPPDRLHSSTGHHDGRSSLDVL